ncbi:UV-damage endonuclease [Carnobacterium iners]|uniref:UV-damage endonuclease n=1 Tax=Carnobacterium iners TaxID=1073423 RepID=A0A1X7N3J8_9LACT|nr:UV DNA damage repair endonuclease UvsE [Carnobacterium iners]SEK61828.1 UV-damage endonuclease [Carnobacterium iners]SMH31958.1 UV-damage endonuclease [Carnobacterium iners]
MKIGYACLTVGVYNTNFKTCTLKSATPEHLSILIKHNLDTLDRILDYNIKMGITHFRISSDIIPFGSSPINTLSWDTLFKEEFHSIAKKLKKQSIRVSMHPGQYTVLNSPNKDIVKRAVEDLAYHTRFLTALETAKSSKIILHIGGVYGDKEAAIARFEKNYALLSQDIKDRLIIENDDKSYHIGDVLAIGMNNRIPVVYDNLHNQVLPFDVSKDDRHFITLANQTWSVEDGIQKIHYSQGANLKRAGSHSKTIDLAVFDIFLKSIPNVDIMLEVKDKNLSAIKAANLTSENKKTSNLEQEWAKYKYTILEHNPTLYKEIQVLLEDKKAYPVIEFYSLIDRAMATEPNEGTRLNAISHVWGYFKEIATEKERKKYESYLESFKKGTYSINAVKGLLLKMAIKYNNDYLLTSYYLHF